MTDPTKVERLTGLIADWIVAWADEGKGASRYPIPPWSESEKLAEKIAAEFIPAQEVERLEQALRELVEAVGNQRGRLGNPRLDAALSQAREILGGSEDG